MSANAMDEHCDNNSLQLCQRAFGGEPKQDTEKSWSITYLRLCSASCAKIICLCLWVANT